MLARFISVLVYERRHILGRWTRQLSNVLAKNPSLEQALAFLAGHQFFAVEQDGKVGTQWKRSAENPFKRAGLELLNLGLECRHDGHGPGIRRSFAEEARAHLFERRRIDPRGQRFLGLLFGERPQRNSNALL